MQRGEHDKYCTPSKKRVNDAMEVYAQRMHRMDSVVPGMHGSEGMQASHASRGMQASHASRSMQASQVLTCAMCALAKCMCSPCPSQPQDSASYKA